MADNLPKSGVQNVTTMVFLLINNVKDLEFNAKTYNCGKYEYQRTDPPILKFGL